MPNNIRELRERRGLSTRQVELRTGIDFSSISRFETNKRDPSIEQAKTLADFFGVSIDYLLDREAPPTPEQIIKEIELPLTANRIINTLPKLSNVDVAKIMGACESVLNQRQDLKETQAPHVEQSKPNIKVIRQ
jgi:transcriptional regulator with XRE-family HTH domain